MAKIFIGIALVVSLITAVVGFMAKNNVAELQRVKTEKVNDLNKAQGTLQVRERELKKANEDVAAAKSAVEEKEKEVTAKAAQVDDLNKKVADATAQLTTKDATIDDLNKKIAGMTGGAPVGDPGADDKIKQLTARAETAETALAEAKQIQETLNRKVKDQDSQMAALREYKTSRDKEVMRPGTSGRILAVNAGWNFVVLSIGDKQGVLTNKSLLVMRGGEPIAKVRVTAIENATSIADVIPGSVRKGVTVQPGDAVVYEGNRFENPKGKMPAAIPGAEAAPNVPAANPPAELPAH